MNLIKSKKAEISIYGIISYLVIIVFLVAFTPAFTAMFGMSKDSQHFNCVGYTNAGHPELSYNASIDTDTMACIGSQYGVGLLAIIVIFGGAAFLITRGSGNDNPVSSQY
jgi:hypothetical protein